MKQTNSVMEKILVIDDDETIVQLLKRFLTKNNYEVETASSGKEGLQKLQHFQPNLIMSDYRLGDMEGSDLLVKIREVSPFVPVIVITGYSDLRTAVKVVRLGAFDYITKPLLPEEILHTIKQALIKSKSTQEHGVTVSASQMEEQKSRRPKRKSGGNYLFSNSAQSHNLERQIDLVAPTNYSVIIYGESGAGKEGLARMIHERSLRAGKPFVAMDCGAISKELAASELFGHEKGAFTGAQNQKIGHFELANGGTIFLDEIANLPYDVQVSLLRLTQEKKLKRLGNTREIDIDVRIIVASNERLSEASRKGKFREDLYHRFNEFSIDVPPLRERKDDILFFAAYFLEETCAELGRDLQGFDKEVQDVFLKYPWYGNLRELKNVIRRAALLSTGKTVDVKSLPFEVINFSSVNFDMPEEEPQRQQPAVEPVSAQQPAAPAPVEKRQILSKENMKKAALEAEYELIFNALKKSNFNKSKAAELLGVDRKTLYNKMKQMNFED
ncbi:MAG: sigma-54 dependent transcriptional regulator [Chitinophagales bacterium]